MDRPIPIFVRAKVYRRAFNPSKHSSSIAAISSFSTSYSAKPLAVYPKFTGPGYHQNAIGLCMGAIKLRYTPATAC